MVGNHLVQLLLEDQRLERVLVLHRRSISLQHEKLQEEIVDFDQPEQWKHLVEGDVLFSCMGTTRQKAGSKEAQYRVDYTYQYQVAETAASQGVSTYVLISAAMASPKSFFFYSRVKGELEEAVKQLSFKQTHIMQPGMLAGQRKESRPVESFSAALLKPIAAIPGLRHLRPIHAKEVARAMMVVALQNGDTGNNIIYHPPQKLFELSKRYWNKVER